MTIVKNSLIGSKQRVVCVSWCSCARRVFYLSAQYYVCPHDKGLLTKRSITFVRFLRWEENTSGFLQRSGSRIHIPTQPWKERIVARFLYTHLDISLRHYARTDFVLVCNFRKQVKNRPRKKKNGFVHVMRYSQTARSSLSCTRCWEHVMQRIFVKPL